MMRFKVGILLDAIVLSLAGIAPGTASAQSYGTSPVCLQVYGPLNYYECRYSTIPQCQQSASGRAAQCIVNPYFAGASEDGPFRRGRRGY
jgi:hypothetical protein